MDGWAGVREGGEGAEGWGPRDVRPQAQRLAASIYQREVFLIYANLSLLLYSIGIPLALFIKLFKWRYKLNPPGFEDESRAIKTRTKNTAMLADPIVKFAIRYRPDRWWYEVYTLGRRFALTSLVLAFPTLEAYTVYVLAIAVAALLFDRELVPLIDRYLYASAFNHALNVQVLLAPMYMHLIDAKTLRGEYSVIISSGLFLLNVLMVVVISSISYTAAKEIRQGQVKAEKLKVLNMQLSKDKQEDMEKFAAAWSKLIETGNEGDEARLLNALGTLALRSALPNGKQPTPRQDPDIKDVDELIEQADYEAKEFHYFLRRMAEVQGGAYLPGPNKTRARAMEKIENDYGGDHTKLVDVVRGSAIFTTFIQLTLFVEVLLGDRFPELIVVRVKDRFNAPLDSGYRDVLLNYKFEGTSGHMGELQLHLRTIIDIKETAHRTYALMRSVGWEDDALEDEEEGEEGKEDVNFEVKENPLHTEIGDKGGIEMAPIDGNSGTRALPAVVETPEERRKSNERKFETLTRASKRMVTDGSGSLRRPDTWAPTTRRGAEEPDDYGEFGLARAASIYDESTASQRLSWIHLVPPRSCTRRGCDCWMGLDAGQLALYRSIILCVVPAFESAREGMVLGCVCW